MTQAVPDPSVTGRVAAALLTSSSQTSPEPKETSNWSGKKVPFVSAAAADLSSQFQIELLCFIVKIINFSGERVLVENFILK